MSCHQTQCKPALIKSKIEIKESTSTDAEKESMCRLTGFKNSRLIKTPLLWIENLVIKMEMSQIMRKDLNTANHWHLMTFRRWSHHRDLNYFLDKRILCYLSASKIFISLWLLLRRKQKLVQKTSNPWDYLRILLKFLNICLLHKK